MTHDLHRLLSPKSIAIVGGGAWGASIIGAARRIGFEGQITLVHPGGKVLDGATTVTALEQIEKPPDATFIAVNRHATLDIVAELAARGSGGAVCFASGFSESVGEDASGMGLQAQLVAAAGDMPILGPNCYGFVNGLDSTAIWPDQHGMRPVERGVAILTQSSNIAINLTMQKRALPLAYMVTCGNQAQTTQADIALALLDDPRVTAIGLHIEGFGDISRWVELAQRASERQVPLIALKSGKSEQAQQATVSHTASLAGSDAGAQALLDRLGIARVDDIPAFLETLKLLHVFGRLDSNRLSSISCSGGEASLAADSIVGRNLTLPPLTAAQRTDLRAALGPMVALANPLDYHTYIWRDAKAMTAAWRAMAADHVGLTFAIVDYPHTDATDWECATQSALAVRSQTGRPFAVASTLPELMPEDVAQRLMDGGVAPICGLRELLVAAEIASESRAPVSEPPVAVVPLVGSADLIDETSAKEELAAYGVCVPKSRVSDRLDAQSSAEDMPEPFVVKGLGLAHKSEAGAVHLDVNRIRFASVLPEIPGDRILIEEMITGGVAELIIGVTRDPAHGFVLTLGAGGVWTELLRDTVSCLVPTERGEIEKLLKSLRISPVLTGYRGQPGADMQALLDAIMAVQAFVLDHTDSLEEVEINPLIVTPDRAVAVDALIRKTM